MATIGQQLTSPESGWKRYDDNTPLFKRSGSSIEQHTVTGTYNGTSYYIKNGSIEFRFIGTKIRIIGDKYTNKSSDIKVEIDGTLIGTYSQYGSEATQILLFEMTGLNNSEHYVKIYSNDTVNNFNVDAIDIDDTGRILHPDEVLSPKDLAIGKRIRCHYQTSSGHVGAFSGLGQETSDFIPPASSAIPNGDFYLIAVDKDHLGRWKLIADRNIQHSISWDTLNNAGIASESGLSLNEKPFVFTGTNNIDYGTKDEYLITGDFTFSAKVNIKGFENGVATIIAVTAFGESLDTNALVLITVNSSGQIEFGHEYGAGTNQFFKTSGSYIVPNKVHKISVIRKTSTKKYEIYVDGDLKEIISYTYDAQKASSGNKQKLAYGEDVGHVNRNRMTGDLYYASLWNRVLSDEERRNAEENNILTNSDGLVNYFNTYLVDNNNKKNFDFTIRLLTGGINSSDTDNEWDKYIVNSTLNGAITAWDDNVWNWSQLYSITSTTSFTNTSNRVVRGKTSITFWGEVNSNEINSKTGDVGFRPVLEVLLLIKSFIYINGEYKTWDNNNKQWITVSTSLPSKDIFNNQGIGNISTLNRRQTTFQQAMNNNGVLGSGKVFVTTVDLNKYFDLIGLNVK